MKVILSWEHDMLLTARGDSGFPVPVDSALEFGGNNLGARPMELILMGVAGCTALDVLSFLKKMRVEITSFTLETEAERAEEHPRVFSAATITYRFKLPVVEEEKVTRAIKLSLEKYCSAVNTVKKAFPISWRYEINGSMSGPFSVT